MAELQKLSFSKLCTNKIYQIVSGQRKDPIGQRVIEYSRFYTSSRNKTRKALFCYISNVFGLPSDHPSMRGHVNRAQAIEIANILNKFGFIVDIIDCRDTTELDSYEYDLIIGHDPAFPVHARRISRKCVKIFYAVSQPSNILRGKILKRYGEVYKRIGIHFKIPPLPQINPRIGIADWLFYKGDDYHLSLFEEFGFSKENSHLICNGVKYNIQTLIEERDYLKARQSVLYWGSWGSIFRGLDRVLEAFSEMPEIQLYICGPLLSDMHFAYHYRKLLFNTPNIIPLGFVDVMSDTFKEITQRCAFQIYPSPSEAAASSVVVGMHAGLIPIITQDCSVISGNNSFMLKECSIEEIKAVLQKATNMSINECRETCIKVKETAMKEYSWKAFQESFYDGMKRVMNRHFFD